MSWRAEAASRWRSLRRRREDEREMEDELRFHLEMETERGIAEGLAPEEARRRARAAFGGLDGVREGVRDERGTGWAVDLARDLALTARSLRKTPGFTIAVVLTLALGIGSASAVFSVVDRVLLRPMPFPEPEELVVVWETDRDSGTRREPASVPDFFDFRERARKVEALAALRGTQVNVARRGGDPERVDAVAASRDLERTLGVRPLLGRGFGPSDDRPGAPAVALLGEGYWRRALGADPEVVGTELVVDEVPATVVGVLPRAAGHGLRQVLAAADYGGTPTERGEVDLWLPLRPDPIASPRITHPIVLLARRAEGSRTAEVQAELAAIAADLERAYPENADRGVHVEPLREVVVGPLRRPLAVLLAAVGLVLLVACVNVAHLLLARGAARRRETAVRRALGAGEGQLLRHFLVETAALTALALVAGLGLAAVALRTVRALVPSELPGAASLALDPRAVLASAAVAGAIALVFGVVPLVQARRLRVPAALGARAVGAGGGGGPSRGSRSWLVVVELALAVTLTIAAGLMLRSFWNLLQVDAGFATRGVVKAELRLPESRYPRDFAVWPDWREVHRFHREVRERVAALPEVEKVALAAAHPLDRGFTNSFAVVGREAEAAEWPEIRVRQVGPEYFAVLRVPVVEGRGPTAGDRPGRPHVAVVNRTAVERFFAPGSSLGEEVSMWGRSWRIVGVVGDERIHGLEEAAPPALYVPLAQAPSGQAVVLARGADPEAIAGVLPRAIRAADPGLAPFGVEPLARTVAGSVARQRFVMALLAVFAGLALLLAAIGVHGLLAYRVALRIPEIGLRMALGALRRDVFTLIVREGLVLAAAGLVVGGLGGILAGRLLGGLVFGVDGNDPLTWSAVVVTVLAAAVLATLAPARRAAGAEPLRALRVE